MELIEEKAGAIMILKPLGRIDASCAFQIKDKVLSMINEGKNRLLLDFSEVNFIDSAGLGTLVSCLKSINQARGDLKICSFQGNPKDVFEMTRLDRIFEVYEDSDEALNSF